jgi:hypothetical protein
MGREGGVRYLKRRRHSCWKFKQEEECNYDFNSGGKEKYNLQKVQKRNYKYSCKMRSHKDAGPPARCCKEAGKLMDLPEKKSALLRKWEKQYQT